MSKDKRKMYNAMMVLCKQYKHIAHHGMLINRKWGFGIYHKPSDNPLFTWMINNGYVTRTRRGGRSGRTILEPTDKLEKLFDEINIKEERQRLADTGKLSKRKEYPNVTRI